MFDLNINKSEKLVIFSNWNSNSHRKPENVNGSQKQSARKMTLTWIGFLLDRCCGSIRGRCRKLGAASRVWGVGHGSALCRWR